MAHLPECNPRLATSKECKTDNNLEMVSRAFSTIRQGRASKRRLYSLRRLFIGLAKAALIL